VQVVLKWHSGDPVEHEIRELAQSVRHNLQVKAAYREVHEVNQGPAYLLGHPRNGVDDDFAKENENDMDEPGTCSGQSCETQTRRRNAPLALTQLALIFTNALRSSASSM